MTSKSTPRPETRFKAGLPAEVLIEGTRHDCTASDLSRAGVLLTGAFAWPQVAELDIVVRSSNGDLEFTTRARVAHVMEDVEAGTIKLGVLFDDDLAVSDAHDLEAIVARVVEGTAPAQLDRLSDRASPAEIRAVLGEMPVPHRIQLARRAHVARVRKLLLHDSSPQVIEGLARNPHLSTPEIIAIARLRTLLPTTVETIAFDSRWRGNEEIQVLTATHPRVTFPVAERIVQDLPIKTLRKVLRTPGLHTALRDRILASAPRGTFDGW